MKAIVVQQPFAFEIMSEQKTIEVKDWDTLHRGDLLICSSRKPAFSKEDMEEMEEEYGARFLYGQALCLARLRDARPMRKGDEEGALIEKIDPEAYAWVFEDIRPVIPFPVKGQEGLFEVDETVIEIAPFRYNQPVVVKKGIHAKDFGLDFSGWHGRTKEVIATEEDARIRVEWDSLSLMNMPLSVIERCEREGIDWTGVLLRFHEIEHAESRDTADDVLDAIDRIIDENPEIFSE